VLFDKINYFLHFSTYKQVIYLKPNKTLKKLTKKSSQQKLSTQKQSKGKNTLKKRKNMEVVLAFDKITNSSCGDYSMQVEY